MKRLLDIIKGYIPTSMKCLIKNFLLEMDFLKLVYKQKKALKRLNRKNKIRAIFLAIDVSVWKYDNVVRLMAMNSRFEPIILVCPMVNHGREIMLEKMRQSVSYYHKKGFKVVSSYDESNDSYVDLRNDLQPDLLLMD